MTWNSRSADPFFQPARIAQLADSLHSHHIDILAIQETRSPSIHIRGFATVPLYFHKGYTLVSETPSWKNNSRLMRSQSKIKGVESQVIDIYLQNGTISRLDPSTFIPAAPKTQSPKRAGQPWRAESLSNGISTPT